MGSWAAELRRQEAARRREECASRQRQKELTRLIKEHAKLSEMERMRLEVEAYENTVEELLSVHKEQAVKIDWARYASALLPHEPFRASRHQFAAVLAQGVAPRPATALDDEPTEEEARRSDEAEHRRPRANHQKGVTERRRLQALARRVLSGEAQAYTETITDFAPFSEIEILGSSLRFSIHGPRLIGCALTVNGREVIPKEAKSLTAAGKLSVKAMPKARFHEIYQDYVCGCALRVARELLALLPVDTVLVTASVNATDSRTGQRGDLPVLSVAFDRATVERLDFEHLDPSDSMENFLHRGDAKTSRKSGEFLPILPLLPEDLTSARPEQVSLDKLLAGARQLRAEIGAEIKPAGSNTVEESQESSLLP